MLYYIEVDGFRSLTDFKLHLQPGVNILIGPNGSGKTNIVSFFEFVSQITSNQLSEAISTLGGAGTVFKKGKQGYNNKIVSKLIGISSENKDNLMYEYNFSIEISFDKDDIYFTEQELKLKIVASSDSKQIHQNNINWDFHIHCVYNEDSPIKMDTVVEKASKRILMTSQLFKTLSTHAKNNSKNKNNQKNGPILKQINNYFTGFDTFHNSLIKLLYFITDKAASVTRDLAAGETFNINPSKVKANEDVSTPLGIKRDGAGLAATLYGIKKGKMKPSARDFSIFSVLAFRGATSSFYDEKLFDKIVSYLKFANDSIANITVDNNPITNNIEVQVSVNAGDYAVMLPLSAMSDGTIKWLALVTAILTSETLFSIEEPENYLHPWMQAEVLKIMRSSTENKGNSFVLMTTHSESLLNFAKPEELVLVKIEDGITVANRLDDITLVKEELKNTHFGLGHLYFSNSLSGE